MQTTESETLKCYKQKGSAADVGYTTFSLFYYSTHVNEEELTIHI